MAGHFVAASVEAARAAGVRRRRSSRPASFPHFGIALGAGIAQNLRAAPWKLALVPAVPRVVRRAARRAARDADLVHAHWIPSALAARATGKPYVLQVWGTDVELARRAPRLVRPLVRGARVVIAASTLPRRTRPSRSARARSRSCLRRSIVPEHVGAPDEPPHVLFAGRLSEEKGILEFLEATDGLPRVIVGDGPLRDRVPGRASGSCLRPRSAPYYERAAVVCVPSRREGYGMTAREAMAYGRPVVATRVGGLVDLEGPGVTLVPPGDTPALRAAIELALAAPVLPEPVGLSPQDVGVALRGLYERVS